MGRNVSSNKTMICHAHVAQKYMSLLEELPKTLVGQIDWHRVMRYYDKNMSYQGLRND